jgi:hypothetical protein
MVFYPESYKFGKPEEAKILPLLISYFKKDIKQDPRQHAVHDYYDDNTRYEVKSRTNALNAYPTTMIPENKTVCDKKVILLFNFTDCIAFIEYNEEKFKNYEHKMFSRARVKWDEKPYIYIPITDLTVIHRK